MSQAVARSRLGPGSRGPHTARITEPRSRDLQSIQQPHGRAPAVLHPPNVTCLPAHVSRKSISQILEAIKRHSAHDISVTVSSLEEVILPKKQPHRLPSASTVAIRPDSISSHLTLACLTPSRLESFLVYQVVITKCDDLASTNPDVLAETDDRRTHP
ncbi:hypothetical protein DPEC_G00071040 [Dallia pectoralis]|uniref:Uncharacterized protein n=1 Tax=Dallia pectoralis TaxID=75939 RepID=A0ACC2H260_DALPE|nr:hypothetical protein DPEC_G00071040 [Dallia pectoralis]